MGSLLSPMIRGAAGAAAVTALHQSAKHMTRHAPRMDKLAEKAIRKGFKAANLKVPDDRTVYYMALAGDLVGNSLFYSFVGKGSRKKAAIRGALLGAGAGLVAVALPQKMGFGRRAQARTAKTAAMTVGLYLLGGLAAALAHH